MSDCLFCKIIDGDINANIIYQNEQVLAFEDIRPQAPHHILIIPRKHIATLNDITVEDGELIGHMLLVAKELAKDLKRLEQAKIPVDILFVQGGR